MSSENQEVAADDLASPHTIFELEAVHEWADVSLEARRCGLKDVVVLLGAGLWSVVEANRLSLGDIMRALTQSGGSSPSVAHAVELPTIPATVASVVGERDGMPCVAITLAPSKCAVAYA